MRKNEKGRKALLKEIDEAIHKFETAPTLEIAAMWATLVLLKCFKFVFENQ